MNRKTLYAVNRMRLLPVLFLLLLFFSGKANVLPPDSLKGEEYPINDPRNPNCPCHKYQEIADKEYAALLKKQNKDYHDGGISASSEEKNKEKDIHPNDAGISTSSESNSSEKGSHTFSHRGNKSEKATTHGSHPANDKVKHNQLLSFLKHHHGVSDKKISHRNSGRSSRHKGLWKRKPKIDSCTHW